jgi:ribosomal protein S18 acetylase RimI-like enzyme
VDADDLRLIDLNLVESVRELARWQDGPELRESSGAATICGRGFLINTALRTDPSLPARRFFERAASFFAAREESFTLWVRDPVDRDLDALARSRDLDPFAETPWMALQKPLRSRALPSGVSIERVTTASGIAEIAAVEAEAYLDLGFEREECLALFARARRLLVPQLRLYLARSDGVPAAAALALRSHGVAGIYWVGTRRAHRGRGLAEACTRSAANDAFALGARFVALHASPMGAPLYRRMGFETVAAHRWYAIPAPKLGADAPRA